MLFSTLGQGYIFLLLLCLGAILSSLGMVFCLLLGWIKTLIKHKKSAKPSCVPQGNDGRSSSRKISFVTHKNPTPKLRKNISKNIRKIVKNITQLLLGFARAVICLSAVYLTVMFVDYGDVRLYHFLAFAIGFCLIKILFAKMYKFNHKDATLNNVK